MNSDLSYDFVEHFNPYKNYSNVKHAMEIWENKGKHSEFWYKLDSLVGKIKEYKNNFEISASKSPKNKRIKKLRYLKNKRTILTNDQGSP